ncbi:hypothetical protein H257_02995 [Aphanomyces astaci]|uniref:Uncharacterized protein n=1 Tax=Aphanomyces astaci TaxID=112090 RepID=W4GZJ9_APHAT|nr:hypothetical protein H257_02995 [Aphanomyces astaci]ETV85155.1 hypothetical protein H257_02995 [Aphanomyces astaci]RHY04383.1 hypothetical protein DYB36_000897 [Aphanomyces astaci]RHY64048.1 hypothetical protein DYB34_006220 [Aphanomyces astaci]RLN99587.1 hypothetical protein DYB28_011760 [Aphanomyces astaci]RQM21183.1 hypothetical protein B5M09_005658 [Aphanomyces astaci]|eukprot:XP_009825173.1 hypothetical protein H257_02995 [Aphanomyces astaci]
MASEDTVSAEELTALVQAIKFAHPQFTVKQVHTQVLSHEGKFASVTVARVKKYLKKLGLTGNLDAPSSEDAAAAPVSLMTVGGDSKSKVEQPSPSSSSSHDDDSHWVAVPLDVPAMQLASHPHQAVIRMTEATDAGSSTGALGEIYKIQKAMAPDGSDEKLPMLMYNKDRSRKSFLHPTSTLGYDAISAWIDQLGAGGVGGGTKAYFYGRQGRKTTSKAGVVFINVHTVADTQPW